MNSIHITRASENNLQHISLEIPHNQLIVVTGVSGSGKSSLVYEVIAREGQRLFYDHFLSGNQHAHFKSARPQVGSISGLHPVVVVGQQNVVRSNRSTVGTLTELYDYLRLLFARQGVSSLSSEKPSRSLFSFNSPHGQCPACKGLGVEDHIDPLLIVGDATKSLREGALVLTTPNNYIIYSQVTMDELNKVCQAEGFSVDIPWNQLSESQQNIVWYGSEKVKVLFGKHTLESRLKWSGITAKPREESYYKGIIPVMEEILKRDRNPNIMRFTRSFTCPHCNGQRINDLARSFRWQNKSISDFVGMSLSELHHFFNVLKMDDAVGMEVQQSLIKRCGVLLDLGLGHLQLQRESSSLSGGEAQRIRLGNQAATDLRNILYILDEPSAGLHPAEQEKLLQVMRCLVDAGNTVIAVEHDELTMRAADWIIDIGPGAGNAGGNILFNGPVNAFLTHAPALSITAGALHDRLTVSNDSTEHRPDISIVGANLNNLKSIDVHFCSSAFNVITGVSGAGKSSLIRFLLESSIPQKQGGTSIFRKVIHIDQSPIGRTPKSNPATYTGLSDHIRDLLASLPESKKQGFAKGQFSFVVKGGRCEECGGAGVQQIGMHFLGNVEVVCEHCNGKRFTEETLRILYKGKSIFDILEMSVDEAHVHFVGLKKLQAYTALLRDLGLGYIKLGQSSTTLSGGEAQRVKLASELVREAGSHTLYILDEPTTGLHSADIAVLLKALRSLCQRGHTILCIEHDPRFIIQADHVIDLGPGSGNDGGQLIFEGSIQSLLRHSSSLTAKALREACEIKSIPEPKDSVISPENTPAIAFTEIATNRLKGFDISIPTGGIVAVCGPSGSGKSSLVFDTIFAECQRRLMDGMSSYVRQFIGKAGNPVFTSATGLMPAIALRKRSASSNPRSTIGTYTGIYDLYRLLYSRFSANETGQCTLLSTAFSFNHENGSCPICKGLGTIIVGDPDKIVTHPNRSLMAGALDGTVTGKFYGEPHGQYIAALATVGQKYHIDFSRPWNELSASERQIAMQGCGEEVFEVAWSYKRGKVEGTHQMKVKWPGFCGHIEEEYARKHADHRGEGMLALMKQLPCEHCGGYRLRPEYLSYRIQGLNIGELCALSADEAMTWFSDNQIQLAASALVMEIKDRLSALQKAGIAYMAISRITSSLSGGEFQRLQLSRLLKSPMEGLVYMLDEPSFGLSRSDAEKMSSIIHELKAGGNTVIITDHSPAILKIADHLIEMGPGAGAAGGRVMKQGAEFVLPYLSGLEQISAKAQRTQLKADSSPLIRIEDANIYTLKHLSAEIPKRTLTVISGNSGSGKTSLLQYVIQASLQARKPVNCKGFILSEQNAPSVLIDQDIPIGSSLSVPAAWLGILDGIRKAFANSPEAKNAGLAAAHFSFHTRDGQCPDCKGLGVYKTAMDFWNDAEVLCDSCKGKRYAPSSLSVRLNGLNVAELLALSIDEALTWISQTIKGKEALGMQKILGLAQECGLGYISLGQSLNTLSSGELQRLKLVSGLSIAKGECLILLDEPTGGLHPTDTLKMIQLFSRLIQEGNTIVCASHDELLKNAAGKVINLSS